MSIPGTRRPALGRGMAALLQNAAPPAPPGRSVMQLPIESVQRSAAQPRKSFDERRLEELATSIRETSAFTFAESSISPVFRGVSEEWRARRTSASVARTESPSRTTCWAALRIASAFSSGRSARACPISSAPARSRSRTSAGSRSSRIAFVTVDRSLPTRTATCSWVRPCSRVRASKASASSIAFRSARWRFSTRAISNASRSLASRSSAGISFSPARCAARQRRSPATMAKPVPLLRTRIGSSTPCSRIEPASSSSRFSSKLLRGWEALRWTASMGSCMTVRPEGAGGAALERRAAIPRPRAGRRLPEVLTTGSSRGGLRAGRPPGRRRGSSGSPCSPRRRAGWACRATGSRRAGRSGG